MARGLGPLLALLSVTVGILLSSEIRAAEKPPDNSVAKLSNILAGTFLLLSDGLPFTSSFSLTIAA